MYQPGEGQRAPYLGNYPRHYIINGDGSGKSTAITSLGGSPSVGLAGRKPQSDQTVEGGLERNFVFKHVFIKIILI